MSCVVASLGAAFDMEGESILAAPAALARGSPTVPTVRRARPADLPALAALEAASFPDPWSRRMLAAAVEDRFTLVLVAEGEGAPGGLAGYAVFRHAADEAELLSLAVAPEARGRGLGRRLSEDGLARVREAGARVCYLEVRPTNDPAVALYRSLGFRQVGRRRRYYRDGSDALVMALFLEREAPPGPPAAP